jgi:hypothetical protein
MELVTNKFKSGGLHEKHLVAFDNMVVLWLLYPYRIITLGSNRHNGDDDPWIYKNVIEPERPQMAV